MSSIVDGIGNLFSSVFEIIYGVISTIVNTVTTTVQTAFNAVIGLISNLFNLAEGVVGLILGMLFTQLEDWRASETDTLRRQCRPDRRRSAGLLRLCAISEISRSECRANHEQGCKEDEVVARSLGGSAIRRRPEQLIGGL